MEKLNYHKLVNLKKRFDKYDCEHSKKILAVIDECLQEEKKVSVRKAEDRRVEYIYEIVACETCGKQMQRASIYKHNQIHTGHFSRFEIPDKCKEILKQLREMKIDNTKNINPEK